MYFTSKSVGCAIPVFYCKDCDEVIVNDETINNVAEIFEKESSDAWVNRTTEELLPQGYKCPKCGGSMEVNYGGVLLFSGEKELAGKSCPLSGICKSYAWKKNLSF